MKKATQLLIAVLFIATTNQVVQAQTSNPYKQYMKCWKSDRIDKACLKKMGIAIPDAMIPLAEAQIRIYLKNQMPKSPSQPSRTPAPSASKAEKALQDCWDSAQKKLKANCLKTKGVILSNKKRINLSFCIEDSSIALCAKKFASLLRKAKAVKPTSPPKRSRRATTPKKIQNDPRLPVEKASTKHEKLYNAKLCIGVKPTLQVIKGCVRGLPINPTLVYRCLKVYTSVGTCLNNWWGTNLSSLPKASSNIPQGKKADNKAARLAYFKKRIKQCWAKERNLIKCAKKLKIKLPIPAASLTLANAAVNTLGFKRAWGMIEPYLGNIKLPKIDRTSKSAPPGISVQWPAQPLTLNFQERMHFLGLSMGFLGIANPDEKLGMIPVFNYGLGYQYVDRGWNHSIRFHGAFTESVQTGGAQYCATLGHNTGVIHFLGICAGASFIHLYNKTEKKSTAGFGYSVGLMLVDTSLVIFHPKWWQGLLNPQKLASRTLADRSVIGLLESFRLGISAHHTGAIYALKDGANYRPGGLQITLHIKFLLSRP